MADFSKFYDYFRENMEALHLPAPLELFGNMTLALGSIKALELYMRTYGYKTTVLELLGAGFKADKLATLGAMQASYYLGAAVGSLAVATGRCLGNGASIADVLLSATRQGVNSPWLASHLARHPGIYDPGVPGRSLYRYQATA
ncbi:hypothetical protein OOT46_30050 [Aquabacterium sp. A7-Y]|uniref:hypothetical protein n=1 Tax=Aquabacterium sp. A7-Y TaxID=1349605 RepID=UPI00223D7844|nr:hypothetical protein [Aquabacterium sp. A7-Y]MCW7542042.1 hypothetical protein [Aquabacterium sp. A7-Y]